jgi:hypothetical protein
MNNILYIRSADCIGFPSGMHSSNLSMHAHEYYCDYPQSCICELVVVAKALWWIMCEGCQHKGANSKSNHCAIPQVAIWCYHNGPYVTFCMSYIVIIIGCCSPCNANRNPISKAISSWHKGINSHYSWYIHVMFQQ